MTKKLSDPQKRMLMRCASQGFDSPPQLLGGRDAGRAAAAWHRTANSLVDRGLLSWISRDGVASPWSIHYYRVVLTATGCTAVEITKPK